MHVHLPGTRSSWGRQLLAFAGGLAVASAVVVPLSYGRLAAAPPPPHASHSIYVATTSTRTAYHQGCSQGKTDANTADENSEVVLDFGGQNSSDSGTIFTINNGSSATYAQAAAYGEQYARGYVVCSRNRGDTSSVLYVALGTNNSAFQVSAAGGRSWSNRVVEPARSWVSSHGYGSRVTVRGANDIEPSYHNPGDTIDWTNGFRSAGGVAYVDYGSSDGCSTSSYNNASCNNGWTQSSEYYVAWGNPAGFVMPEIYYDPACSQPGSQAPQWTLISRYGHYHGSLGKIFFDGPLTQYPAGCTSKQAWRVLWRDLNTNAVHPLGPDGSSSTSQSSFDYRSNI